MREYTTERGIAIGVMPIPLLLEEVRKAHPFPKRPTYTEHLAGNAEQEHEITDAEAEAWAETDPDTWAEHAEAWTEYERKRDAVQEQLNDRIWLAVLRSALKVELPEDDGWIQDQEELGLVVPKKPKDRLLHYIRTEVIGGARDKWRLTAIANGGDLSEEVVSLAEASFRGEMERSLLAGLADKIRALAAGNESGADEDAEGVARTET